MSKKNKEEELLNVTIPLDSGFTHILFNIAAQGYSHIMVEYSGSGDSGNIDNVCAIKRGGIKEEDGFFERTTKYDSLAVDIKSNLEEVIKDKAYDHVLKNADDWCNNDGGGGTLYISTDDGKFHANHYVNIIEILESTIEGTFGDS